MTTSASQAIPLARLRAWRRKVLTTTPALVPGVEPERSDDLVPVETVRVSSFYGTSNVEEPARLYVDPVELGASIPIGFSFESPQHPGLEELRRVWTLDAVAGTGSDIERMARLASWVRGAIVHAVPYEMPPWDARVILDRAQRGVDRFLCMHMAVVLVQAALSLGYQARVLNLHMEIAGGDPSDLTPDGVYAPEHVVAEVWLPDIGRWVMLDADSDCYFTRRGVPLNAWDLHDALVADGLNELACVRGPHAVAQDPGGTPIIDGAEDWFLGYLPRYFRHVSVLMRNDFLARPDAPTPVAHPIDSTIGPVLWRGGIDLRGNPLFLGPVRVAAPLTRDTTVLTDGRYDVAWASADDSSQAHTVEVTFRSPEDVAEVVLFWAEFDGTFQTSRRYRLAWTSESGDLEIVVDHTAESPVSMSVVNARGVTGVRITQEPGDGPPDHPNRLWLTQVEVVRSPVAAV